MQQRIETGQQLQEKRRYQFPANADDLQDFAEVSEWHQKFMDIVTTQDNPLPRDILTRLSQIYSAEELKGKRWAWRSLYYFHRMQERYKRKKPAAILEKLETRTQWNRCVV